MKKIHFLAAFFSFVAVQAQHNASDFSKTIEKKWLKNETSRMVLYSMKDTARIEIGKMSSTIAVENGVVTQTMTMENKMFNTDFVDITAYYTKNFKPIFHCSNNDQRLLTIAYRDSIHAVCRNTKDKTFKTYHSAAPLKKPYFDSSVYQTFLRWLPLKDGYHQRFSIFNYDPNSESGMMTFEVLSVSSEKITTSKSGVREVWKVVEKYADRPLQTAHYIDKEDRKLWKQEINGGKIIVLLEE